MDKQHLDTYRFCLINVSAIGIGCVYEMCTSKNYEILENIKYLLLIFFFMHILYSFINYN